MDGKFKVVENDRIQNESPSGHLSWDSNLGIKTYPFNSDTLTKNKVWVVDCAVGQGLVKF